MTNERLATAEGVRAVIGAGAPFRLRRLRRLVRALLIVAVLALGAFAVAKRRGRATSVGPAYETMTVGRGDLRVTVTATGTLEAVTTVEVGAEVTGKLLRVNVERNARVKKGQELAVIDPEQLQAAVDQAAAQVGAADASVLQALATITETRLALERARSLRGQGLLGQGELETANANAQRAEAGAANARAQATLARASLKSARSKLDKTIIYSPIDGTVLTRLVEPGQTVTAGFTTPVLFKIAQDLTRMALTVAVDEADVGRVSDGLEATFTVEAYPERLFVSKVLSVGNEPTKTTNVVTYDAVLTVDNADRALRPGMTCTSTIVAQTRRDVLLVSNAALRFSPPTSTGGGGPGGPAGAAASSIVTTPAPEGTKRVWLLRDGKTLEPFDLHTGATDGVSTEIAEGALPVGTQVVVDVKEDAP